MSPHDLAKARELDRLALLAEEELAYVIGFEKDGRLVVWCAARGVEAHELAGFLDGRGEAIRRRREAQAS